MEAVKAVEYGIDETVTLLERLSEDTDATQETRGDAFSLLQSVLSFNFLAFLSFWCDILKKIDRVQKRLQDPKMNFREASLDLKSL